MQIVISNIYQGGPLTIPELIPIVSRLSHQDKLRLIISRGITTETVESRVTLYSLLFTNAPTRIFSFDAALANLHLFG